MFAIETMFGGLNKFSRFNIQFQPSNQNDNDKRKHIEQNKHVFYRVRV